VRAGRGRLAGSRAAFKELTATHAGVEASGWTHDQLEDRLETGGRALLRRLYQDHLDLRALREQHAVAQGHIGPVVDADGTCHRKVEPGHVRHLTTVFGTVRVTRCAWRADGTRNQYPADAALNLPCRLHSHTLRRRAAIEAARGSFGAAQQALTRACGKVAGKRQVEQLTVAAASDIDAFYQAQVPQPATDDTLLVLSVDGKGVVMRPEALREPTRKAAAVKGAGTYRTRLAGGEKQGRKRMATLGTVYDADPAPRRPHDVMTPAITLHAASDGAGGDRGRRRRTGPVATAKWLTGSIAQTSEQVIAQVFNQADQRDPTHRRTWIVLVDGARHQLDLIRAEAQRRGVKIHILVDFIHVLEYVWRAAWCFYQDADPAAEPWVAGHALRILAGEADTVITALGQQATDAGLTPQQRGGVDACIGYLQAKRELLGYNTALARGWPIATGVIEGACGTLSATGSTSPAPAGACKAPRPSSSCAPCTPTTTSLPTGASTSPRNTGASTRPATSTRPPVRPDQPVPEMEPHPRSIWRLPLQVVGRAVKVGGLATVGELHPETQELIGQGVTFETNAVNQVRELLLLSGGDSAQAQAEGEAEPFRIGPDAHDGNDGLLGARDDQLHRRDAGQDVVGWPEPGRRADHHGSGDAGRGAWRRFEEAHCRMVRGSDRSGSSRPAAALG
jgi:hypothetical protein